MERRTKRHSEPCPICTGPSKRRVPELPIRLGVQSILDCTCMRCGFHYTSSRVRAALIAATREGYEQRDELAAARRHARRAS